MTLKSQAQSSLSTPQSKTFFNAGSSNSLTYWGSKEEKEVYMISIWFLSARQNWNYTWMQMTVSDLWVETYGDNIKLAVFIFGLDGFVSSLDFMRCPLRLNLGPFSFPCLLYLWVTLSEAQCYQLMTLICNFKAVLPRLIWKSWSFLIMQSEVNTIESAQLISNCYRLGFLQFLTN